MDIKIDIKSDIVTKEEFNQLSKRLPLGTVLILKKLYEGTPLDLVEINHIQQALRQDHYSQLAYHDEMRFRKEED